MAAVGSNTPITSLLLNLFIGIALGTNVVIANAIGSNDKDTVHKAVHSSVSLTVFGLAVTLVGELASRTPPPPPQRTAREPRPGPYLPARLPAGHALHHALQLRGGDLPQRR